MGLFQLGFFGIIITNLPSVIVIMLLSISVQTYDGITSTYDKLGNKIGEISKKSKRLFYIIPFYVLLLCNSVLMLYLNSYKYLIVNLVIIITCTITTFIYEKRLFIINKKMGVYEHGIFYKKDCVLFNQIPEILIDNNHGIEILNRYGSRELINLDINIIQYIKETVMNNTDKLVNTNWNQKT